MNSQTNINTLHCFSEHPARFWPAYLEFACHQGGAEAAFLLTRKPSSGSWKNLFTLGIEKASLSLSQASPDTVEKLAETALQNGSARTALDPAGKTLVAILLSDVDPLQHKIALFIFRNANESKINRALEQLQLIADAPAVYQRQRSARQALKEMERIADTLDVMILLNDETRYLAATMTLVNETAARYHCARVSLGWCEKGYVRLQSISHMDRFEKKMDIVASLEAAMEEAFDQDEEILWPGSPDSTTVVRDHARFAGEQNIAYLLSVPIRLDGPPIGVLTCENENRAFTEDEIGGLRILCDQAARRLSDLKAADRSIFIKLTDDLRHQTAKLFGVENTLVKLVATLVFALLMIALIVKLPYRIEAPFMLRSEDVRQVSVPFEGYIDDVHVRIGQQIQQGDLLLSLDSADLLLEEAEATANLVRYIREAEKARARNVMSEMQIAQAQADQAKAELELVRYRLSQAELRSPIDGIVVDGDLEELRGAPVSKGDILFKVARSQKLFAEIKIDERDIHELKLEQPVKVAFVSQPQLTFHFAVDQIDPIARADEEGNLFRVRATTSENLVDWWRPGMSGIAKVEIGNRRIAWILTHRTIDFFRMLLWW